MVVFLERVCVDVHVERVEKQSIEKQPNTRTGGRLVKRTPKTSLEVRSASISMGLIMRARVCGRKRDHFCAKKHPV